MRSRLFSPLPPRPQNLTHNLSTFLIDLHCISLPPSRLASKHATASRRPDKAHARTGCTGRHVSVQQFGAPTPAKQAPKPPKNQPNAGRFCINSSGSRSKKLGTLGTNPKNACKSLSPLNKSVPKTTGDKSFLTGDTGDKSFRVSPLTFSRPPLGVWYRVAAHNYSAKKLTPATASRRPGTRSRGHCRRAAPR